MGVIEFIYDNIEDTFRLIVAIGVAVALVKYSFGTKEKEDYKKGFNAGKKYIKDNVKLTVSNDAIASSYQTLRHYRESLIKWIEKL